MASRHPDLHAEQAYIDAAHTRLVAAREKAALAVAAFSTGAGGTQQARFELESMIEGAVDRLTRLEIGDRSLVFGRIDPDTAGRFYIGRVGLWDDESNPIVVDWRAPVAEAFYRATGGRRLDLRRRRHFISRGSTLLGIEDELFGEQPLIGVEISDSGAPGEDGRRVRAPEVLEAALEAPRTGRLSDIAATIQAEQDEIIRADLPGVLAVQGGPGTGKTAVALHRASYLLYTHRFPLESQGVLVLGPNRLFLAYIEQVLPSLGEAGVELAVLEDLLEPPMRITHHDSEDAARVKGDPRMAPLLRRAARDRQRPLRSELVVGYGLQKLRLPVERTARIVEDARRRHSKHNAGRQTVEQAFFEALTDDAGYDADTARVRELTARRPEVREALEWMWPVLTPACFLKDLFGSKALLSLASAGRLEPDEIDTLHRPRGVHASEMDWSFEDVALLDEARVLLGPRPGRGEEDSAAAYGHIVVDEAQDLSPMQLRMIARRSLNGSMTVVGDIAQATAAWVHEDWDSILEELPRRRPHRQAELTIGYRIPAPVMALANRVLPHAASGVTPTTALRRQGDEPRFTACGGIAGPGSREGTRPADGGSEHAQPPTGGLGGMRPLEGGTARAAHPVSALAEALPDIIETEKAAVGQGNVAVVTPASLHADLQDRLAGRGCDFAGSGRHGLERQVLLLPVRMMKGLEVDAVIVVEPGRIVAEEGAGSRSLYVALTRCTKRLRVVHAEPLPRELLPRPQASA